jgi:hypothetical protein
MGVECISASLPTERAEKRGSTVDLIDKYVMEKFAAFERAQEPALVQEALETIEAAEQAAQTGDPAARKQGLSRWLRFFAALDRHIVPNWDPKDVPETGLIPPPSHGVVYPSGVDPAAIPDLAVRAQYEQTLKASKDHAERYRVQLQLQRIDERAMRGVGRLLAERYTNSPEDRQEFEGLLAASPMNNVRKEWLRALMPKLG